MDQNKSNPISEREFDASERADFARFADIKKKGEWLHSPFFNS